MAVTSRFARSWVYMASIVRFIVVSFPSYTCVSPDSFTNLGTGAPDIDGDALFLLSANNNVNSRFNCDPLLSHITNSTTAVNTDMSATDFNVIWPLLAGLLVFGSIWKLLRHQLGKH